MKWICQSTLPLHHTRSIYSVSWSKVHKNLIVSVGGDGCIKVIQVQDDHESGEGGNTVNDTTIHNNNNNNFKIIAQEEEAHGHSDINCVEWCPPPLMDARMSDADRDAMGLLFLTTGDDGVVKVWRLVL